MRIGQRELLGSLTIGQGKFVLSSWRSDNAALAVALNLIRWRLTPVRSSHRSMMTWDRRTGDEFLIGSSSLSTVERSSYRACVCVCVCMCACLEWTELSHHLSRAGGGQREKGTGKKEKRNRNEKNHQQKNGHRSGVFDE